MNPRSLAPIDMLLFTDEARTSIVKAPGLDGARLAEIMDVCQMYVNVGILLQQTNECGCVYF